MRLALAAALLAAPALADGAGTATPADVAGLSAAQAEELLAAVVLANVASSSCAGVAVTDGEWALLVGTADRIAHEAPALDVDADDARFHGPAFAALDRTGPCEAEGPGVRGIVGLLVDMGGVPDGPPPKG